MKFSCEKYLLQNAVNISLKAVASKTTMPSLEGILIEATDKIKVTGYDLKKAIYTVMVADIEQQGSILVNAKFFSEMLRRMPDGIISVTEENNNITIRNGKIEYKIVGMDTKEYPELPIFNEVNNISIPQNILRNMINETIFAVSKEEIRPIYTGELFDIEDDKLTIVAIDGYRLAKRVEKIEGGKLENCSFVVPGFTLSDLEKICDDTDDLINISVGDKHISFKIEDTVIISRKLEGEFINYKTSITDTFRYVVNVNRQDLINVIDRVSLVMTDKAGVPLKVEFGDGSIECSCKTPVGEANDICVSQGNAENMKMGFNDRYIMDSLKAASNETISVCLNTSSSPCIIKPTDGSDKYTYMILPVRLQGEA